MADLLREIRFAIGEKSVVWMLLFAVVLSSLTLTMGLANVAEQSTRIDALRMSADEDRAYALASQNDAGGAAYYAFHLAYDPPSTLAFVALGLRDELPWMHRIRMLALEGQIYENDAGNPELSSLGALDFAYLASIILPLLVIGLLYDLDARERRDARFELLCASSRQGGRVLHFRALARIVLLLAAILTPLLIATVAANAWEAGIIGIFIAVILHALFWLLACRLVSSQGLEASTAATVLLGTWLLLTVLVPIVGKSITEQFIRVPHGGDILFVQREAVNDAWDLPKVDTMEAFVNTHPKWRDFATVERPFEWKWYYAFQQVGDQRAEPLSAALEQGMRKRTQWMRWIAFLTPPLLTEQWLNKLAKTDVQQHLVYMRCMRAFHATLRDFHYPMLFSVQAYAESYMGNLPQYRPCQDETQE